MNLKYVYVASFFPKSNNKIYYWVDLTFVSGIITNTPEFTENVEKWLIRAIWLSRQAENH